MANDLMMDPGPELIPPTIGQEFVDWAEQYWGLKRKYDAPGEENSESCPYDYVKKTFASKIDEIIASRIAKM